MADIYLRPEDVEDAISQLTNAVNEMQSSQDESIRVINGVVDQLDGSTVTKWHDYQTQVNSTHQRLLEDFHQGTQALQQIVHELVTADTQGAQRFVL